MSRRVSTSGEGTRDIEMQFPAEPDVVFHIIAHVLNKLQREVGAIELMKIVYLIDVEFWRLFGRTMSGAKYRRDSKGPFSTAISSARDAMCGHELRCEVAPGKRGYDKHAYSLGDSPRFVPKLDAVYVEVAGRVLKRIHGLDVTALEELAYQTEPMQAIIQEEELGHDCHREPLDFSLIKRDPFMAQWLANQDRIRQQPIDLEYERHLRSEKEDFTQFLALP